MLSEAVLHYKTVLHLRSDRLTLVGLAVVTFDVTARRTPRSCNSHTRVTTVRTGPSRLGAWSLHPVFTGAKEWIGGGGGGLGVRVGVGREKGVGRVSSAASIAALMTIIAACGRHVFKGLGNLVDLDDVVERGSALVLKIGCRMDHGLLCGLVVYLGKVCGSSRPELERMFGVKTIMKVSEAETASHFIFID
jgi:hypothetical protein